MIDPITAVSVATAAFKGVQQLVNAGREIEDVMGQLGKWYGAVSDFRHAEQQNKNPSIFKKLMFKGSVEEEALQIFAQKKKIDQQEYELQTLIKMYYGPKAWEDLVQLRRKIRKEREDTIYKQAARRKAFVEALLVSVFGVLIFGLVGGIVYFVLMFA